MKKFLAVATGALILGTCALTACNTDNDKGADDEFKGQYTEITTEELTEKLNALTPEKMFGDTAEKNWSFGFKLTADVDVEADLKTVRGEKELTFVSGEISDESTLLAKLTVADGDTPLGNFSLKARNSNKIEGELKKSEVLGMEKDIKLDYNINAYADDQYLYFQIPDMSGLPVDVAPEGKYKASLGYIVSSVTGLLPFTTALAEGGEGAADFLTEYNLKAFADDNDGLKIKVSADKQSLYAILEKTVGMTKAEVDEMVTLNEFAVNLYFETAENGSFEKAGLTVDIKGNLNIKEGAFGGAPALSGPVCVDADILIEKYDGEIVMPNPEELEEYVDITSSDGNE